MKAQELKLVCHYTKENCTIAQLIQSSFNMFLRKELHNIEKRLHSFV